MSEGLTKMRSAVSAILSEPSEASCMAFPDYSQTSADHRRGLILVIPVGSRLSSTNYGKFRDKITSVTKVSIPANTAKEPGNPDVHPDSPPRMFRVRYTNVYPVENNDWGDFQIHRSLIGLVCVGGYSSPQELCELSRLHDVAKAKYGKTLLDTRLVAIGVNENDTKNGNNGEGEHSKTNGSFDSDGLDLPELETNQSLNNGQQSATTTVCFYQSKDFEESLEADVADFNTGLFWVLESKRREMQKQQNSDKLPFLCAPFEKKDFVGLDLESRTNKKRTYGRFRKYLGDQCLLCDLPSEALSHYETSVEILRSCNDWIWLAGALEGLCSISVMVHYPSLNKKTLFAQRNPSYDSVSPMKKKISFDETPLMLPFNKVLKASEIIEKYKECVVHYSKYRHAGVIETEASIKAVRVLTEQCNYLLAAEFLQNIVFINLQMNDEEKIQRFSALADLYKDIGFRRKAAFFLRVAAMRCVAPQNPHPDWGLCYSLLLKANAGYCIDLTNTVALKTRYLGWPALQVQLMQEMVGTARRMGNHGVATRHMTYLLEVMFEHLSEGEKADFSHQLNVLTSKHPGTDLPLTLDGLGGLILPPVPLYKIPKISSFTLCPLPSHLIPRKKLGHRQNNSVFVFTPLNFGGNGSDEGGGKKQVNFQWVAHDVAEVCLTLYNPLPIEVKVVGLALLHEGIQFENFPSTLSVAPNSGPHSVSLLGVPKEAGELKILGYTLNILGVQSSCKLRGPNGQPVDYKITVLPSLPQLDCVLKRIDCDEAEKDQMLRLYQGESAEYQFSLTNISNILADNVEVSINANPSDMKDMFTMPEVSSTILEPGQTQILQLQVKAMKVLKNNSMFNVTAAADFAQSDAQEEIGPSSISSVGGASVISRHEPNRWSGRSLNETRKRPSFVTLEVKVIYSGGAGGSMGYLRELIKTLKVDICPSAVVSKWDILPSEVQQENYLVLDISNQCIHEMEIEYGPQKKLISIEPQDDCRIPVPVQKFAMQQQQKSQTMKERHKFCLQYLEDNLHIMWSLPRLQSRLGKVSLKDIKLDDNMISSLELCPLEWCLTINEAEPLACQPQNLAIGQVVTLQMSIKNMFAYSVKAVFKVDIVLEDSIFSEQFIAVSQPESQMKICKPKEKIIHSTAMLPLVSGTYDVICSCSIYNDTKDNLYVSYYPKISLHINDD